MNKTTACDGIPDDDQRVAAVCAGGSRYYDLILKNGWFEHLADGTPTNGLPYDRAGSDIDTTNPDGGEVVLGDDSRQHSEQGIRFAFGPMRPSRTCLRRAATSISGPGTEFFNVYPLFHTAALYDGFRRDDPEPGADSVSRRVSGRAAQRGDFLVVGYLSDMGHAEAADSYRAGLHCFRA